MRGFARLGILGTFSVEPGGRLLIVTWVFREIPKDVLDTLVQLDPKKLFWHSVKLWIPHQVRGRAATQRKDNRAHSVPVRLNFLQ